MIPKASWMLGPGLVGLIFSEAAGTEGSLRCASAGPERGNIHR